MKVSVEVALWASLWALLFLASAVAVILLSSALAFPGIVFKLERSFTVATLLALSVFPFWVFAALLKTRPERGYRNVKRYAGGAWAFALFAAWLLVFWMPSANAWGW